LRMESRKLSLCTNAWRFMSGFRDAARETSDDLQIDLPNPDWRTLRRNKRQLWILADATWIAQRWLHICVANRYTSVMGKDVGMRIRVERDLRDRFTEACQAEGETAAAVLRRFMRQYAAGRAAPAQGDLFEQLDSGPRDRRGPVRSDLPAQGSVPRRVKR
jgi:hypothetical protein